MCSCTSPGGISAMPDAGSSPFAKAPLPVGRRRWSERPLAQLILVRIREFAREPEAVFWTFLFPVLMTAGLGIAFRSKPEETTRVAVLAGAPAAQESLARLRSDKHLEARVLDDSAAAKELRTGRIALVVAAGSGGEVEYRYDDTLPERGGGPALGRRALPPREGSAPGGSPWSSPPAPAVRSSIATTTPGPKASRLGAWSTTCCSAAPAGGIPWRSRRRRSASAARATWTSWSPVSSA